MHLSIILCYWSHSFVKFLFISLSTCLLGYFSLIRINILNILICQSFHIALSFHTVDGIFPQLNVICSNRYLCLYFQSVLSRLQNSHICLISTFQFSKYFSEIFTLSSFTLYTYSIWKIFCICCLYSIVLISIAFLERQVLYILNILFS